MYTSSHIFTAAGRVCGVLCSSTSTRTHTIYTQIESTYFIHAIRLWARAWCDVSFASTHWWWWNTHAIHMLTIRLLFVELKPIQMHATRGRERKREKTEQFNGILSIQLTVKMNKIETQTDPILPNTRAAAAAAAKVATATAGLRLPAANRHSRKLYQLLLFVYVCETFLSERQQHSILLPISCVNIIHSFIALRSWWQCKMIQSTKRLSHGICLSLNWEPNTISCEKKINVSTFPCENIFMFVLRMECDIFCFSISCVIRMHCLFNDARSSLASKQQSQQLNARINFYIVQSSMAENERESIYAVAHSRTALPSAVISCFWIILIRKITVDPIRSWPNIAEMFWNRFARQRARPRRTQLFVIVTSPFARHCAANHLPSNVYCRMLMQ